MGASPPGPPLPTLGGLGFAGVLGPTRGGVAKVGYLPPFKVLWGDTPHNPPPWGFAPWTPIAHPRELRACQRFGPHSWRGDKSRLFAPNFGFVGGHPPHPLSWGLCPLDPRLPALGGLGFAGVLGPTRGRVAKVGYLPLILVLGGTSPKPPARGLCPLDPRLPALGGLRFAGVLGPTRGGVTRAGCSPLILVFGGTSLKPPGGGCALSIPSSM